MSRAKIFTAGILAGILTVVASEIAVAADEISRPDIGAYYEKPGKDLSQYNAVLLDSLSVEDARVVPPPWVAEADRGPRRWSLTDSDMNWLQKSYREAMQEKIAGKEGYPIVEEPGPGVLILDVAIIYLMPYARKGEDVETRGFGKVRVQAQLRDGMTQELLAIYEGTQDVGSEYQLNTRLNNESRFREMFEIWGTGVRGILDSQRNKNQRLE